MIHIDRMSIQLPEGFDARGQNIARLVGEYLQKSKITNSATIDVMSVSNVTAKVNDSDESIAGNIANSILSQSLSGQNANSQSSNSQSSNYESTHSKNTTKQQQGIA